MRVLHIGKYFPPDAGGIETYCRDLLTGFADTDVNCRMQVFHRPGTAPPDHPAVVPVATRGEFLFTPLAPDFSATFARQLAEFRPELIHVHVPNPAVFRLLRQPGARHLPWVATWHSDVVPSRYALGLKLAYPAYRVLEKRLLKRLASVLFTSPDYAEASPASADVTRYDVVPLGIDATRLTPRAAVSWPGTGGKKVAAVGRFTYYKGFDRLLAALAGIPDVSLLLLGSGQLEDRVRQQIDRLGLKSRVTLISDASDAQRNQAIAEADCLCLPSIERTEAFGLVLLEAMGLGTPVVATRIPGSGVPWVVESGGHGVLAAPDNVESLRAALSQVLEDEALRARLSAKAEENFPRFRIEHTVRELARIYREVMDQAGGTTGSDPDLSPQKRL
ncbi:MAG: glycosyltransferase [Pseudomonadota bacterium]